MSMKGEWVSVNERLPDFLNWKEDSYSDSFLITDGTSISIGCIECYADKMITHDGPIINSDLGWGAAWIDDMSLISDVTHWMPLPDVPLKERE